MGLASFSGVGHRAGGPPGVCPKSRMVQRFHEEHVGPVPWASRISVPTRGSGRLLCWSHTNVSLPGLGPGSHHSWGGAPDPMIPLPPLCCLWCFISIRRPGCSWRSQSLDPLCPELQIVHASLCCQNMLEGCVISCPSVFTAARST